MAFPNARGQQISRNVARFFNTVLLTRAKGTGPGASREICTRPQGVIDVKSSAPSRIKAKPMTSKPALRTSSMTSSGTVHPNPLNTNRNRKHPMSKVDFSSYLNVKAEDIERPRPLPIGHFFATLQSWRGVERFYDKENPKKATPSIELTFKIDGPDHDVDTFAVPANLVGSLCTRDYNLVEQKGDKVEGGGQAQLKRLAAETMGLDIKGLDLEGILDAMKGSAVRVYNEPRPDRNDPEVFYTNIKKVISAED